MARAEPADVAAVPAVSVVVVSDYATGTETGWRELRATLDALAKQDFDEPLEILLCESEPLVHRMPADITTYLPSLRIVPSPETSSYALKNFGARVARAEIVAILDADVIPAPSWLRRSTATLRRHPDAGVVSARSLHSCRSFAARAFALLERGYIDPGSTGPTRFLGNHAAVYRRATLLAHPFHPSAGPFSSRLQSESIQRAGQELLFDAEAVVFHTYDGLQVQLDIARNTGYGTIVTRQLDSLQPFAWLAQLGVLSIPFFVAGKTLSALWLCVHRYRDYRIHTYEVPLLLVLAVLVRAVEVPGMWRALRGGRLDATLYR